MIPELDELGKRIQRLERHNRFLKQVIIAAFSLVIVSGLWAQTRNTRTIEAEKFVLLDSKGRARVTIGTPQTSGVAIGMTADEPSIWISDEKGVDRVIINTEGLRLANSGMRPAASLTFEKETGGQIRLFSNDGRLLYYAPK